MKTKLILSMLPFFLFACSGNKTSDLTQSEKDKIIQEVNYVMDSIIILGCETLNMDLAINEGQYDYPGFKGIGFDGSVSDFKTFFQSNNDFFNTCSSCKINTLNKDYNVLTKDLVLGTWTYKGEIVLKTGDKYIYDKITQTSLFKRIDGRWRSIYFHESTLPPQSILSSQIIQQK